MYEAFYGFRENPFRLTPDPDYLFLSTNHQEALGHLLFGVKEGNGVVVVTGGIGTGKTTLLRTLVRNLDPNTSLAYIFNPALSALELLRAIHTDLGLAGTSQSKKELIEELNRFLLEQRTNGKRVVVVIDEAQGLEPAVLEQLRLLSNLETEREKLLQIILVGQPELGQMLAQPSLAQLDQRVTLRWHLAPLSAHDTVAYVRHRIRVATTGREPMSFSPSALRGVYRFSGGVPRLVNILCHRSLLIGYTRGQDHIDRRAVRRAARELSRNAPAHSQQRVSVGLSFGGALLLAGLIFFLTSAHHSVRRWWLGPAAVSQTLADASPPAPHTPSVADAQAIPDGLFLQALQKSSSVESAIHATAGLLQTWQVEELHEREWQAGTLDLEAIAHARQLEHLEFSGNLSFLGLLNLPSVVELHVPERQESRFVLVVGMDGEHCRVLLDREYRVSQRVLTDNWFGKGRLFWKDFEDLGDLLAVGHSGQQVDRLHSLLSRAQVLSLSARRPGMARHVFGPETELAVARFQRGKRLTPDGVVGPLTMILLYHSVPGYHHPRLSRQPKLASWERKYS